MAYDEALAARVRAEVASRPEARDVSERRMFGGLAFMVAGNMFCGIVNNDLMLRVGPDAFDAALTRPGVRPMDFSGRPMRGMVYVSPEGLSAQEALADWLDLTLAYAGQLAPKQPGARPPRRRSSRGPTA
jgi:TfoX/Sxy family transcriptional regulator of competence genes